MSLEHPADEVLMEDMRHGRGQALEVLFDRYHRLVFAIARRVLRDEGEAEDLMQEVFLEIFRKADLYDQSKGSVKGWLLQYAYHRGFNRRKYLALRAFYDASPAAALADEELAGEWGSRERLSPGEWQQALRRGIEELSQKERQVIESVAFDGLTVREASERLQESYTNGRNHYYRGLKKLREFLGHANPGRREVNDVRS